MQRPRRREQGPKGSPARWPLHRESHARTSVTREAQRLCNRTTCSPPWGHTVGRTRPPPGPIPSRGVFIFHLARLLCPFPDRADSPRDATIKISTAVKSLRISSNGPSAYVYYLTCRTGVLVAVLPVCARRDWEHAGDQCCAHAGCPRPERAAEEGWQA